MKLSGSLPTVMNEQVVELGDGIVKVVDQNSN